MPLAHPAAVSVDPYKGGTPQAYIVRKYVAHCACCATAHARTQVFVRLSQPSRFGLGAPTIHLRAINYPTDRLYNLPIVCETYPDMPATLPFCHACHDRASLAHYPALEAPARENEPAWRTQEAAKVAPARTPARKPTIDDLI